MLFACSGTHWAIKVHLSSPRLCQHLMQKQLDSRTMRGRSWYETDANRASVGLSGLCLTSVHRDERFIRRSFWESINLLLSTAKIGQRVNESTTINNLRRMRLFSAHCRLFLVNGWCCAKSFGSEILAQA